MWLQCDSPRCATFDECGSAELTTISADRYEDFTPPPRVRVRDQGMAPGSCPGPYASQHWLVTLRGVARELVAHARIRVRADIDTARVVHVIAVVEPALHGGAEAVRIAVGVRVGVRVAHLALRRLCGRRCRDDRGERRGSEEDLGHAWVSFGENRPFPAALET